MALEIISAIATWSECYKSRKTFSPSGIVVHSTGANNPNLKRYVNSPAKLGENIYKNYWGTGSAYEQGQCGIPHAAIGKDKNGNVAVAQVLPFNVRCWGCGSGKNGSYNVSHIQFEICEDGLTDKDYFEKAFDLAARFCAELVKQFPAIKIENIVSHREACARGYASNHGDPENWLSKFGRNMNWFRDKVKGYSQNGIKDTTVSTPAAPTNALYRVQIGAFKDCKNAENYLKTAKAAGYDGFVVRDKDNLLHVQIGAFSSVQSAEHYLAKAKNSGFTGFVVKVPGTVKCNIKVGDTVMLHDGAADYNGGKLALFVYGRPHIVSELNGDRAVITYGGAVVAAVNVKDLILE